MRHSEKLPPQFNPTGFDPAAWVALAKAAGMKYITITSKHHDGFAMFDSKIKDGSAAQTVANELGLLLRIPQHAIDPYDTVVELEFAKN